MTAGRDAIREELDVHKRVVDAGGYRITKTIEIGKTVTDREQVVRDKVRQTDVRVEDIVEKGSCADGIAAEVRKSSQARVVIEIAPLSVPALASADSALSGA